jgi:hypothetical protein
VAAVRGEDRPRPDRLTQQRRRLLTSPMLEHTLGANGFFIALLRHARSHPGSALTRWWSPEQCSRFGAFGLTVLAAVIPEGHGIWADRDRPVGFFLEHDTGSADHRSTRASATFGGLSGLLIGGWGMAWRVERAPPLVRLRAGPLWLADTIRAFAAGWERRPGRPPTNAVAS